MSDFLDTLTMGQCIRFHKEVGWPINELGTRLIPDGVTATTPDAIAEVEMVLSADNVTALAYISMFYLHAQGQKDLTIEEVYDMPMGELMAMMGEVLGEAEPETEAEDPTIRQSDGEPSSAAAMAEAGTTP